MNIAYVYTFSRSVGNTSTTVSIEDKEEQESLVVPTHEEVMGLEEQECEQPGCSSTFTEESSSSHPLKLAVAYAFTSSYIQRDVILCYSIIS